MTFSTLDGSFAVLIMAFLDAYMLVFVGLFRLSYSDRLTVSPGGGRSMIVSYVRVEVRVVIACHAVLSCGVDDLLKRGSSFSASHCGRICARRQL